MTQRFILDENIVILAEKGETDRGEPDLSCRTLFAQIIEICHTIVLDPILWDKYHSQLWNPRYDQLQDAISLLPVIYNAVSIAGKVDLRATDASPFPEEGNIPQGSQDDLEVVRLAVETGASLVTTDESLRHDLDACGIQETYHLRLLSPSQALDAL